MKTCKTCKTPKDEAKFRRHRRECRECGLKAQRESFASPEAKAEKNKKAALYRLDNVEAHRGYMRKHLVKYGQFINLLKMERPCYDCGGMFPPEVTDWDHLPGTEKKFAIGTEKASRSLESLIDEIAKCQLVCSNCHRVRTASRREAKKKGDE